MLTTTITDPGTVATFTEINRLLPIQVTTTQPDCNFSGQGIIEVNSLQPKAFLFTVSIDGGSQRSGSFPMTLEGVSGGNHIIEVTSNQGCFSGLITVDNNLPDFAISFSDITESCSGQSTGSARAISSGTGFYSYQWSNGSFGQQLNNVSAGTYQVYVRQSLSNCRDTATVVIPESPSIAIDSQSFTDATGCTSMDGSITFSATGDPTDVFLYSINGGSTTNSTGVFTGLNPGEYPLTVISSLTQCEFYGDTLMVAGGLDPAPTFEVSSDSVCRNELGVIYKVMNVPGTTFFWNAPSGSSIASGNGTNEIILDFNSFSTGTLEVSYQYPSGCGSDTLSIDIVGSEQNYTISDIEVACEQETFGVPLEGAPALTDVLGLDFCMQYDESVITPTGTATIGDVVTGGNPDYADYYLNISTPGIIYGVIYYTAQAPFPTFFSGSGLIIDIDYTLNPGVPTGTSTDIQLCGVTEGSLVSGNVDNCSGLTNSVNIVSDPEFNSVIEYWDRASKPLIYDFNQTSSYLKTEIIGMDAGCNPTGYTALTDTLGEFSFNSDSASHIAIVRDIPGEYGSMVDCTNIMTLINGADQNRALQVATNDVSFIPTAYQLLAADVNLDGSVSSLDVTLMSARSVMSICGFPNNGSQSSIDWLFIPKSSVDTLEAFQISTSYPLDDGIGYSKNRIPSIPDCIEIPKTIGPLCVEVGMDQYAAILIGDVSGNWQSEDGGTARVAFEEELVIDFSAYSTVNGKIIVPISYAFSELVNALDFYIQPIKVKTVESLQINPVESYAEMQMNWNLFSNTHLLLSSFSQAELPQEGVGFYLTINQLPSKEEIVLWNQLSKAFINGKEVGVRVVSGIEDGGAKVTGVLKYADAFQIYPNPSNEFIHIDFQEFLGETSIRILSLSGQTIQDFGMQMDKVRLDIRGILPGIYILQFTHGIEKYQRKIVIK